MTRPEQSAPSRVAPDGSPVAQDLLDQVRALSGTVRQLPDLLSLDLARLRDDASLLAAVLAGAVPPGPCRAAVHEMAEAALRDDPSLIGSVRADLEAAAERNLDPGGPVSVLLFYRGFQALLAYRVCHHYWTRQAFVAAQAIKTAVERALACDIHPAARIGTGVWIDHGVGVVIGETAVIEDDVSIWHGVTLGGTLKDGGAERHPLVRRGATIGASATLLGRIEVGEGAVVAAGAVVLRDVPPGATVAGVPARLRARSAASFRGFAGSEDEA